MPIFGAKSRAARGCASKLACGHRIVPAEQAVFTKVYGKFVTFSGPMWASAPTWTVHVSYCFAKIELFRHAGKRGAPIRERRAFIIQQSKNFLLLVNADAF